MAAACAFAMVGAFALFGCSTRRAEADEPKADEPKADREAVGYSCSPRTRCRRRWTPCRSSAGPRLGHVQGRELPVLGRLNEQLAGGAYADVLISAGEWTRPWTARRSTDLNASICSERPGVMVTGDRSWREVRRQRASARPTATGDYAPWPWATSPCRPATTPTRPLSTVGCYTDPSGKTMATSRARAARSAARRSTARGEPTSVGLNLLARCPRRSANSAVERRAVERAALYP